LYLWGGDDFVSTPGGVNKRSKVSACGGLAGKMSGKTSGKMSGKTSGKILDLINENNEITIPELSNRIGVTERTIERNIRKLRKEGKLKRVGGAKGGHWKLS